MTLLEMAEQCPDVSVTIKVGDLVAANEALAARAEEIGDSLIPEREAIRALGNPDPSTLYRWRKRNYLTAVKIGARNYYTASSIRRIINNHTVQPTI